ncbi:MAG: hypothetical protein S4CHLAM20_10390 [Chlamydiia bacterium]|nr:hypothetical protein [Chlamydiia bacterium]
MNRKEIIIFSVFVNMALLTALFISALRPTLKGEMSHSSEEVVILDKSKNHTLTESKEIDQVDQILKDYIAKAESPIIEQKQQVSTSQNPQMEEKPKEIKKPEKSPLIEVIVRSGDVLEKIARRHRTTVEEIMTINKMKDTRLRIGQTVYLRENTRKKTKISQTNKSPNKNTQQKYYVVKKGDSAWTVAIKNHIKVADLLKLNDLNESRAKRIKPGDRLRIR